MAWRKSEERRPVGLSEKEMEAVTAVFRSYQTGLREATMHQKVEKMTKLVSEISFKISGSSSSIENVGSEPHGAGDSGPYQ